MKEIEVKTKDTEKTWTEAQEVWTENFYWGEPGIRGNAYQCYRIAYPNQSKSCWRSHSSKMEKSSGVQDCFMYLKKKHDAIALMEVEKNPKSMPIEDWIEIVSEMGYNTPNPITGKRPYSDSMQKYGLDCIKEFRGIVKGRNINEEKLTAIQINVNPIQNEKEKKVINIK